MHRRPLVLAVLAGALALTGCKSCRKTSSSSAPPAAAAPGGDAGAPGLAHKKLPPATEPDPDYEARRDELLRRGNPEMMKPGEVIDVNAEPEVSAAEMIKPVSKDVMMVKDIKVDLAKGRAELPAHVSLNMGPLEFVAVTTGGKAYESLLTVDSSVVELRLALTLLGFEGVVPDAQGGLPPADDSNSVHLLLRVGDKEAPIGDFMIDRRTGKPAQDAAWQVVGFDDAGRKSALTTKQLATVIARDAEVPLRITTDAGNPYAGPDQGLVPNSAALPAATSDVVLILQRHGAAPQDTRSPGAAVDKVQP
ncbi:MAG: hypothetical protein H6708_01665 [Kofleriaceae bacterium]|nr:hypothetical protein [Myxococcales bacterium]MCB9559098.1 hypothetical protein [Kofleriaceae bacterium]